MHSKMMYLVLVVLVAMLAAACAPKKSSNTVNTANGHSTCTSTRAGTDCSVDTERQYRDCMAMHTPDMGNSRADMYCRSVTSSGNQLGGAQPVVAPGAMPGTGGVVMGGGGYFPGYPASAPVFMPDNTPIGVINTQNNASGGYMMPGAPAMGGATSNEDVIDLGRATVAQRAAFCRRFPKDPFCCAPAH